MKVKTILFAVLAILLCCLPTARAQRTLSLDSCRTLALNGNKRIGMAHAARNMAKNTRKAARTGYLPKVDAVGTWQLSSREMSLLSKNQKTQLNHLGDNLAARLQNDALATLSALVEQGTLSAAEALNAAGQSLRKAFRTNTRNLFGTDILVKQPIYMGGSVKATNKMADVQLDMADNNIDLITQQTIYDVEQAYWLVVSLRQKQILAARFLNLVRHLHDDVAKMLAQGMATRADELRVAVRVNEAELSQTQVDDGLTLARMHLCQICGLPPNSDIRLTDEDGATLSAAAIEAGPDTTIGYAQRPELRLLADAVEMSRHTTTITRAAFLPQLMATGGYMATAPNVYDGYQNNLSGTFHVGLTLRVPVWNWGEGSHRIHASKAATTIARLELDETNELIRLQVSQAKFSRNEACKRLHMATHNLTSAEESLRCANVGFKEGVMKTTDVMEAQTAWQLAQSQKIDAEIGVVIANVGLRKALGVLTPEAI